MDRTSRIAGEMRRIISQIIMTEIKDPRLPLMTSVMDIDLAKDLKYAKVYVSVYGSDTERKAALEALHSAEGFIRREVGKSMTIRYVPELTFIIDQSIERGAYMSSLIDKVISEDKK